MGEAGKPRRRAGQTVLGVRWEVEKRGGCPGDGARDREDHSEGLEKGGRRRGTSQRGGKEGIQTAYFVGFF